MFAPFDIALAPTSIAMQKRLHASATAKFHLVFDNAIHRATFS
ncbi:hypothetical protein [Acinetobacter baretiae]|nr:hypothetical protein [Acinetobacter baretiae]